MLILAVGFGVFRILKATKPVQEPPQVQERVWRVDVQPVAITAQAPELELFGRVETPDLLRATAAATAWVTEVAVRDGDRVSAGQVLVRLDERDFASRIAQAEAELADLEAQIDSERNRFASDQRALEQEQKLLELARAGVARQQRLKTQQVGAEQALDESRQAEAQQALAVNTRELNINDHPSRLRALEARRDRNQARLAELRLEFARATVRAPYDGVVSSVEVTVGDQVTKGAVLGRMYALDSLQVRARVPAPFQGELIAAMAAGEPLEAVANSGGVAVPVVLDRLAGEADPSGVDGLFRVSGDPALLRLGQLVTVRLERPARDDAVAVPFQAVYGGDRLYVVNDGRLRGIDVEPIGGRVDTDGVERLLIRSPLLQAGDQLVTTHLPNAMDGLRVEVLGANPSAAVAGSTDGSGTSGEAPVATEPKAGPATAPETATTATLAAPVRSRPVGDGAPREAVQ